MQIGLSISFCVRDIATGKVAYDDVAKIAGTKVPIKMTTVRMALLAAYNLGRQQVMRIRNAIDGSGLNQYAHTIRVVFDKMAVVYKEDSSSGDLDEAAMGILAAVDADAFAEVLSTAQQVDEES